MDGYTDIKAPAARADFLQRGAADRERGSGRFHRRRHAAELRRNLAHDTADLRRFYPTAVMETAAQPGATDVHMRRGPPVSATARATVMVMATAERRATAPPRVRATASAPAVPVTDMPVPARDMQEPVLAADTQAAAEMGPGTRRETARLPQNTIGNVQSRNI